MAKEYTLGGPPPQSRSEKILMNQNPGPAQSRIEELLKNASSGHTAGALVYKGTVETALSLPSSGNEVGDVYHVNSDGSEWAWNGEQWEELGAATALSQMGFVYYPSLNGTAPDYYVSATSTQVYGDAQNYTPEEGSILAVRAPTAGVIANATLKYRVSTQYSASWPIYLRNSTIPSDYVKSNEVMLLMFKANKFYVVGVVRDPITVPTKLSDLENDLNLTSIQEIDLSSSAQSLGALLAANKTAITTTDGEKTTFYRGNTFASVVYDVGSAFVNGHLPVVSLGEGAKFPVIAYQYDEGTDNAWFSVKMSETETSGTSLFGFTHEIVIAFAGVVIHTQKYEIDIQTLPSGS